jgi:bifunctional DNase/RNase
MEVVGLALDSSSNSPIVLLREVDGERLLPIWIGIVEASAIAFEIESQQTARPLTHALLIDTVEKLGARVLEARIIDLKDNTFFAEIRVIGHGAEVVVDARPSDAIAVALRARVPIACSESVLERVQALSSVRIEDVSAEPAPAQAAEAAKPDQKAEPEPQPKVIVNVGSSLELKDLLQKLSEEDFGKYKM